MTRLGDIMSVGIYVHIPFCKSKCNYCDFNSYAGMLDLQDAYADAVCREIHKKVRGISADTVYFGGGTPSVMDISNNIKILNEIKQNFCVEENAEITIECNPATIDEDGFKVLKEAGFNRISLGAQSANDKILKILGRAHSFDNFKSCFYAAREAGFNNISADIMFALPSQNIDDLQNTLSEVTALGMEHISCYALKIEEGTPFYNMNLSVAGDDLSRDMYDLCVKFLEERGYTRYEISNFATAGYESRHNNKYWKCKDYIGLGAGAHSCFDGERCSNVCGIKNYIDTQTVEEKRVLTREDKISEFIFLGLRMTKGISEDEFKRRFDISIDEKFGYQLDKFEKMGCIIRDKGRIKIAPDFLYVSNAILSEFV